MVIPACPSHLAHEVFLLLSQLRTRPTLLEIVARIQMTQQYYGVLYPWICVSARGPDVMTCRPNCGVSTRVSLFNDPNPLHLHLLPLAPKNQNSSYSFSKRLVESLAPHRPQHILAITCTACPPHPAPGNLSISWALPSSIPQMGRIPPPRRPNRARTSKLRPPRMLTTTINNVPGHTTSSKQNSGTRSSMEDPEDGSLASIMQVPWKMRD